jgi:uncharacterized protein YbjT (DUF2867 family)
MAKTVAVTGATGQVGGVLARRLRERGVGVRAIGRSAERLKALVDLGAEARVGSVEDEAFLTEAFRGVDGVFAMIPPSYGSPDQRGYQRQVGDRIASAVEKAGALRVVSLSSLGAELPEGTGPIAGLYDFEQRLNRVRGARVLHLRPGYFFENHLNGIGVVKSAGIFGAPIQGDVSFAMTATRDIGAAAADALMAESVPERGVRELLGPRAYTMREAAAILGRAIGRPDLPYVEFPYEDARQAILGMGFSPDAAGKFIELYDALNKGRVKPQQGWNAETTTPTTLDEFAKEVFAPAFRG